MGTVSYLRTTLGDETWGERVTRARMRSGESLRDVAQRVSLILPISHASIANLEKLPHPPRERRRRMLAFLMVVALGYDPRSFGLSADDLPPGIDMEKAVDLLKQSPGCITTGDVTRLVAA